MKSRIVSIHYIKAAKRNNAFARWLMDYYENFKNLKKVEKRVLAELFKNFMVMHFNNTKEKFVTDGQEIWRDRLSDFFKAMRENSKVRESISQAANNGSHVNVLPEPLQKESGKSMRLGILATLVKKSDNGELTKQQKSKLEQELRRCNTDSLIDLLEKI